MPYYKDPDGKIHFIEDGKDKNLLPIGSIKISKKEAAQISTSVPNQTDIKKEANKRILSLIPAKFGTSDNVVSEMNMIMEIQYLLNKKIDGIASEKELDELTSLILLKESIDNIRKNCKDIIIDLKSEIDPINFDVKNHPLWP